MTDKSPDEPDERVAPGRWDRIATAMFVVYAVVGLVVLYFVVLLAVMYSGCAGNMGGL